MSGSTGYPLGFIANMKWQFEGDIPAKLWKQFRTKFSREHAPGWRVKKLKKEHQWRPIVHVSFHTTDIETARTITGEQWEFLKATISLLVVKETINERDR